LDKAFESARFFDIEIIFGIESFHFAGDLGGKVGRIEQGDAINAGIAGY